MSKSTGFRYICTSVPLPLWKRVRYWLFTVWDAMTEVPPKTYLGFKKLAPGDPGYDKAHFNECIDDKPLRFNSK